MTETPQLDMHIYLRGKDAPIYLHGVEAQKARQIREDLTPGDDPFFSVTKTPWYDLEHKKDSYRVLRADVHVVKLEPTYVNPAHREEPMPTVAEAPLPPAPGSNAALTADGHYEATGADPQIPAGTEVDWQGLPAENPHGNFS